MRRVLAIAMAVLLVSPLVAAESTTEAPKSAGPPKELLESAHQLGFARECYTDPAAVSSSSDRTPPRSAGDLAQPTYPPAARRAGKTGTATLLLLVNEEGRVVRALIERSAGDRDLDQAALDVTDKWKFIPAQVDKKPHCAWGRFALSFNLHSDEAEGGGLNVPIYPEAERLVEKMFDPLKYAGGLAATKLLRGSTDDEKVVWEVAKVTAEDDEMAKAKRHWAGMWSAMLSRDELQKILDFYETPAGKKWLYTYRDFDRRSTGSLAKFLGAGACNSMLAQRALARGKTERGIKTEGVPEDFIAALPGFIQRNEAFCDCAAEQFRQGLETKDPALRGTLIERIKGEGRCPAPDETGW